MKKVKSFIITSAVVSLIACGDDSKSSKSNAPEEPLREVPTIYDLGACTKDRNGDTVLVIDKAAEYLCIGNDWLDITTQSTDVPQPSESDGISSSDTQTPEHPSSINGDAENSSSSVADDPLNNNSSSSVKATYIEVAAQNKLTICDSSNIGLRALVLADSTYFTCKAKGWVKDSVYLGYEIVKTREDLGVCNTGNAKQRILVKKDSVFFNCDSEKWVPETSDGYIVKNASILGAAQKGPFKFDSPLMLREVLLHNDALTYTGREYIDEISSNKGDFVIPKVNLVYPYAVLEVRGQWRNEISGEWSKDSMTLRALTDLTSRTEVNINLLTHLEYDRAVQLVSKGYSIFAAKKQAEYEIMTAFGFATTIEYSENLKTFVASTSKDHESNATLMAIALLFIGDRSEAEIVSAVNDFKRDMASDGTWNDEQAKADMADWAESFDGGSIRANVKSWNILTIPDYENYLTIFWNNAYELGGCSSTRSSVIVQNKNAKSKNYNVHYICKATSWQKATDYEKDTYQWADGEEGEVKKGNVTETYYVFEDGKWEVATVLEYDTYGFGVGDDGEVRVGKVNKDKYYVYENGSWRASASEIENNLGACVTSRLNEVSKSGNTYYTCKTNGWTNSTALEYDTYGWEAGTEGAVKPGRVNSSNHYVYENGTWRTTVNEMEYEYGACMISRNGEKYVQSDKYYICENKVWKEISAIEYGLGYCMEANNGVVKNLDDVYYICKSDSWTKATVLEYDTYQWLAGKEGEMKPGSIISSNHYVYVDGSWRASLNDLEYEFGVCVTNKEGEKHIQNSMYYICENKEWKQISIEEYGLGYCTTSNDGVVELLDNTYYICKSKSWKVATALEYDTYGWIAGTNGEIKAGSVNSNNYYIYKYGRWSTATSLEYDTYGKTCQTDGSVVDGEVVLSNKYVCDAGNFRTAENREISLDKGCVSYTDGNEIRKHLSATQDSVYLCGNSRWRATLEYVGEYGTLIDSRDNNTYKTVVIGTQTWMAENLNYSDSVDYPAMKGRSWCYANMVDSCSKYGRLYTWAVAMDGEGTWSSNGVGCTQSSSCTPTYPVRGICPEGWHLPTKEEWNMLFTTVGGVSTACNMLWLESNYGNAFGFSALPAGYKDGGTFGYNTLFWSATPSGSGDRRYYAEAVYLSRGNNGAALSGWYRTNGSYVRCLQDSP